MNKKHVIGRTLMDYNLSINTLLESFRSVDILIIPNYSMRSYINGLYDIENDGNFNMVIHRCTFLEPGTNVTITIPQNRVDSSTKYILAIKDYINDIFKVNIMFTPTSYYKLNALETRKDYSDFNDLPDFDKFDSILFAPESIGEKIIDDGLDSNKFIYWGYTAQSPKLNPTYFNEVNFKLCRDNFVSVGSRQDQEDIMDYIDDAHFNSILFSNILVDFYNIDFTNNKNENHIVFYPFRHVNSDLSKALDYYIAKVKNSDYTGLYTCINDSENLLEHVGIKVDHKVKSNYYEILQRMPLIFYPNNLEYNWHFCYYEFLFFQVNLKFI